MEYGVPKTPDCKFYVIGVLSFNLVIPEIPPIKRLVS